MYITAGAPAFPFLADIGSYDAGTMPTRLAASVLLLVAILKCVAIAQRPHANTKCALALLCAYLPFAAAQGFTYLMPRLSLTPFRSVFLLVIGVGALLFIVISLILAVIGLVEMASYPDKYEQGRTQAIWALILSGVFLAIAVPNFVRARSLAQSRLAGGSTPGATTVRPGKAITFEDLNFRIRAPERPWVSFDGAKVNTNARVAFLRQSPEVYLIIIPEKMRGATQLTCDQLAVIGKAHLESAAESCHVLNETHTSLNGLDCLRVETEATVSGMRAFYQHWYIATNGFAYQLVGYGRLENRADITRELAPVVRGFELLDSGLVVAPPTDGGLRTNFVSPQYDYTVAVSGSSWGPYVSLEKEFPQAEFGASQGDSCFVVVPVGLAGESPGLDNLTAGLLGLMAIDYPDDELRNRAAYTPTGLEGVKYDFDRSIARVRYRYRLGIVRGADTAYLVAAWTSRLGADGKRVLDDAFDRVHFDPKAGRAHSASRQVTARELKTQASVLNRAALVSYKATDYDQALRLFRAASRTAPAEKVYVVNSLLSWFQLERPTEALAFIESQPPVVATNVDVRAWQAFFQAEASMTAAALTNYASLFAQGYRDDTQLARYVRLLNSQHRYSDSLAAIESYQKQKDSISGQLMEAETYRLKSDFPKALSVLKQLHEKAPFNLQVTGCLAETALAAGLYNDALEASRDMVARNNGSPYALQLRGRSELGLKWYRDAKVSFEAAAKLAPTDKTIASYLEHVNGLAGEGNNSAVKEVIEPVVFPLAWAKAPAATPPAYAASYGAYYQQRVLAISWKPGRDYKSTEYFRVQVLDSAGVSAFSTLQWVFDPAGEQLYVNDVRVLDANNQIVSKGTLASYYVLDERRGEVASHRKVLNVPVAGLQPGYQLVASLTRRDLSHPTEFPYLEHSFSTGFPVRQSHVLLTRPASDVKYVSSPAMEPEKSSDGLCWNCVEPLVARYEPLQSPWTTFGPTLWLSDKSATWREVATGYLASISDRLRPDPAVTDQARKVTSQARSAEARTAAIAAYVQTNYTYKAIEFGRRARIPNTPAEVLGNKYGDCKDQAVLLQQMLAAAGVPARLALVDSIGPVQPDVPSLDQFNHIIVFVPGGKGLFIDPTDKGGDPLSGSPVGLAERDAFILDATNSRFAKIPAPAPESCGIELERHLRLEDEQDVISRDTITAHGIYAAYLRGFLKSVPAASRKMLFQQHMGLADAELTDLTAEPLETPGAPLKVECVYTLKKQFHRSRGQLSGLLRGAIERTYLGAIQVDKRLTPFENRVPLQLKSTVTFEVPAGFSAELPPDLEPALDARFATCTNGWRLDGHNLVAQFECREIAGKFKAADYDAFRQTMSRSLSLLERDLVLDDVQRAEK